MIPWESPRACLTLYVMPVPFTSSRSLLPRSLDRNSFLGVVYTVPVSSSSPGCYLKRAFPRYLVAGSYLLLLLGRCPSLRACPLQSGSLFPPLLGRTFPASLLGPRFLVSIAWVVPSSSHVAGRAVFCLAVFRSHWQEGTICEMPRARARKSCRTSTQAILSFILIEPSDLSTSSSDMRLTLSLS
jgi:hypothetical protein